MRLVKDYARWAAPSKYEGPQKRTESIIREGDALRSKLEGRRILTDDHSQTTMAIAMREAHHAH
jgi:hypothetical protein